MSEDALAQLNVLTGTSKVQEWEPRAGHQVFIEVPLRKEPLGSLRDRRTCLSLTRQTRRPASVAPLCAMCPRASNFNGPERLKPREAATDASVASATDAAQRPSLLCTEASLHELIDRR
jgi:hypothetical protein